MLATKRIHNELILQSVLSDIAIHYEGKLFVLEDIHQMIKSMDELNLITEELSNNIINYLVESGYDEEDYATVLGLPRGTSLICRLLNGVQNTS